MRSIFLSHSSKDRNIVEVFRNAFNDSNVKPVFMEYERHANPPWQAIKNAIQESSALFVLLGTNLKSSDYTQNWVSYEVGVADASNKPIWIFEDINNNVNFPIPNVHHYVLYSPYNYESMNYLHTIISSHAINEGGLLVGGLAGLALVANPIGAIIGAFLGSKVDVPQKPEGILLQCPYVDCHITFQFYNASKQLRCPACRRGMQLN